MTKVKYYDNYFACLYKNISNILNCSCGLIVVTNCALLCNYTTVFKAWTLNRSFGLPPERR